MKHSGWLITLAILCAAALSAAILACGSEEPTERRESTRAERDSTAATSEGTTAVPTAARSRFAFTDDSNYMLDLVPATAQRLFLLDLRTIRENQARFPGNFDVLEAELFYRIEEHFSTEVIGIEQIDQIVLPTTVESTWFWSMALLKGNFDFERIRADYETGKERLSYGAYDGYELWGDDIVVLLEDIGVIFMSSEGGVRTLLDIMNSRSGALSDADSEDNELKRILEELGNSPAVLAATVKEDSGYEDCGDIAGSDDVIGCVGIGSAYSGSDGASQEAYIDIVVLFSSEEEAQAADDTDEVTPLMEEWLEDTTENFASQRFAGFIGLESVEATGVSDVDLDDDIVTSTGTMKLGELLSTPAPRPTLAATATPAPTLSGAVCAPFAQPRTDWDPAYHLRTIEVRSVNKRGYSNARLEYVVANPGPSHQLFYLDSRVISHPEMFSEFNRYPMSELDIRAGHGTEIGEEVHPDGARNDEFQERILWQNFDHKCPLQIEISVYADPNRRNLLESVLVTLDFDQQGDVTDASIDFGSETTESRPQATPSPQATPAPRIQPTPAPQATPAPTALPQTASGPGAVYRGDGDWAALAGPALLPDYQSRYDLGDGDGQVPLDAILQHQWIFESGYYRSLVDRARLDNPTPLTSSGRDITLKLVCINSRLYWCRHLETYFVPNVAERTNGQVTIEVSSFPELGMAGSDTGQLLAEGWVEMPEIYGGYVAREFPSWELQYLWGLWPDDRSRFEAQSALAPDLDRIVSDDMGSQPLFRNWIAEGGVFLFSDEALEAPEDFGGLRVRSFGASLSDWITGMGGEPQFVAFSEIYTALDRGILDVGVTSADGAYGQRWYQVADYMNGPLYYFQSTTVAVSNPVWDGIPTDLQQILIEEGARHELESLRLATIQGMTAVERFTGTGIQLVEFSPEIRAQSRRVAIECVIPGWLERIGHPSTGRCAGSIVPVAQSTTPRATPTFRPTPPPTASVQQAPSANAFRAVDLFNRSVGPIVGLRIEADGTVTELR